MAFSVRNLSVLAYANGFTLWLYKSSADDQHTITNNGFFEEAGDMLASGDMLMISALDGGRMLCVQHDTTGLRTAPLG